MSLISLIQAAGNFFQGMERDVPENAAFEKVETERRGDKSMVIIAVFGGLVAGGAIFAFLKNSGSKAEASYTKLNIV